ncbi:MAG: glycosyltransferase family 39 protein [Candidatus Jettenia sp.]|nr:glycosyltransferase family 39 protein [Candidatus Jettenia sp.]
MNFCYRVTILFCICLLTRLCFVAQYLDSCDSIDFALGLHDYDISRLQPHFPGYPVYLFTSWLFFKLFHHDVWALVMPGVLCSSLTIYPLSSLARHLFSERVALLTAVLYLINPLCWLQAERPTSDAMGLFFIIVSAYFLYRITFSDCDNNQSSGKKIYLFLGSLCLGFGLGVRLSYFPFIILWIAVVVYLTTRSIHLKKHSTFYGCTGFITGISLWLFPQIAYIGWYHLLKNGLFFSHGHFTDWGGSIVTFGGLRRIACLVRSTWEYGLGGWWSGSSFFRLIPSFVMVISLLYSFKQHFSYQQRWFLGMYMVPYLIWINFGQNVANPRHILPVIPILLLFISHGLCKAYDEVSKDISIWRSIFLFIRFFPGFPPKPYRERKKRDDSLTAAYCPVLFILTLIVSMSIFSLKLVIRYHHHIPAPIRLVQFVESQFDNLSTRVYCSEAKRFFEYYTPLWDVRMVRNAAQLNFDLQSSIDKPQNILVVYVSGEDKQFGTERSSLIMFQGNPYTDGLYKNLFLSVWNNL